MARINEMLKQMREDAGLRQEQIALFLGVTQTFISKVESGERTLAVEQLEQLAELYGYPLASFQDGTEAGKPLHFAYRSSEVSQADLHVIAAVGRIAQNARFMEQLLGENHD
jgi:transcriptional regulator with XRE-family HTH domain